MQSLVHLQCCRLDISLLIGIFPVTTGFLTYLNNHNNKIFIKIVLLPYYKLYTYLNSKLKQPHPRLFKLLLVLTNKMVCAKVVLLQFLFFKLEKNAPASLLKM